MAKDEVGYDRIVERQLRGVAREVLSQVAAQGLPGEHHFYVTFHTDYPGVSIGPALKAQFPQEITIVLQHQFWGLEVTENAFTVTLSFGGKHERLHVPFEALVSFADPSVNFALQFELKTQQIDQQVELQPRDEAAVKDSAGTPAPAPVPLPAGDLPGSDSNAAAAEAVDDKKATVIALDTFRKKR